MFVRVKSTPNSPRKSVQIVQSVRKADKVSQKIVRYVGIAMDDNELEKLKLLAESIKIKLEAAEQELLFSPEALARSKKKRESQKEKKGKETEEDYKVNLKDIEEQQRVVSGVHDVYGKLFDESGYGRVIPNPARHKATAQLFKDIVMARIANPRSKMATVDMLEENYGITLNLERVYQMMDKLDDKAIERLNSISYGNTAGLFGQKINLVLFDCTTLYFESFKEDEFKRNGYSKDLKFNQPQVLLALMVTREGLPLGYEAFAGDTYEGHTIIPVIKKLKSKHNIDKVIIVADAGMFNKDNIEALESMESEKYEYVIGSRIKSLPKVLKDKILNHDNYTEISEEYKIAEFDYKGRRLIVSYSEDRARKDAKDRDKAVEGIRKKLKKVKKPKEYLSNYGYKKYIKVEGESKIKLDNEKIDKDRQWDGLHGTITNSMELSNEEVVTQYHNLWQVENAFRVTKHDLRVRPIFHWKPRRVKAHLAISFAAYSLVKHLEYRVKLQYKKISPERIRRMLINVQTSILYNKKKKIRYGLPSKMTMDARKIYDILKIRRYCTPYIIEKM